MAPKRKSTANIVFVSHAHEDAEFATALKDWLERNLNDRMDVIDVFVSSNERSLPPGTEWPRKIRDNLKNAFICICIVSPHSFDSRWLYFESGATYIKGIPVVPICWGGVKKEEIKPPLYFFQALEMPSKAAEKSLMKLVAETAKLKPPRNISKLPLPEFQYSVSSNWQFSEQNIAAFEQSVKDESEIWVVSANLDHDAFKGALADAVACNLKRGISYTYVVPQKDDIYPRVDAIKNLHSSSNLPPKFRFVERDEFDNITETNITIYNPVATKESDSEVFIELPIDREPSKRLWARVDKYFSDKIIGRIRNLREISSDSSTDEGSES
jgi:hypothetical protein